MSGPQRPISIRRIISILWLPACVVVLLSVAARVFVLVFPLMMAGVITAIVLLQRPTWGIGRRVVLVAGVGAIVASATFFTAVGLQVLPAQPVLLVSAFALTQLASLPSVTEARTKEFTDSKEPR